MPKYSQYRIDLRHLGERSQAEADKYHLSLSAWARMIIGQHLDTMDQHQKRYDDPTRGSRV